MSKRPRHPAINKAVTLPLHPAKYCENKECGKMLPDVYLYRGKYRRPNANRKYCSGKCSNKVVHTHLRRGELGWIKWRYPELLHLFD